MTKEGFLGTIKGHPVLLGALATVVLGVFVFTISCYSYVNGIRNTGIEKERALTAQYLDNQNYLSAYISGFYEQLGVQREAGNQLDRILEDAVKGRYDKGGFAVNSPLFAAIVEAYPEAGVEQLMENWGKLQDYIAAQREGYRNVQSKLLDMLRSYDTWRETGIIKSSFVRTLGFPSNRLEARVGEMVLTGEAARDKMYHIVLTSQAIKAYESGEMDPLKIPPEGGK